MALGPYILPDDRNAIVKTLVEKFFDFHMNLPKGTTISSYGQKQNEFLLSTGQFIPLGDYYKHFRDRYGPIRMTGLRPEALDPQSVVHAVVPQRLVDIAQAHIERTGLPAIADAIIQEYRSLQEEALIEAVNAYRTGRF